MSYLDNQPIYYVYGLFRGDEPEPFYIGKGKGDRHKAHLEPKSLKLKSIKNNIIKKALSDGISIVTKKLHENLTEEEAFSLEIWHIYKRGRIDKGTGYLANHTDGGDGTSGLIMSEHTRKKKSLSMSRVNNSLPLNLKMEYRKRALESYMNRSQEERLLTRQKTENTRSKWSIEKKNDIARRTALSVSNVHKNRTPEERKMIAEKASATKLKNKKSPWEHASAISSGAVELIWRRADTLYQFYINGCDTAAKLAKSISVANDKVKYIFKHFSNGWIPLNDAKWLAKFKLLD